MRIRRNRRFLAFAAAVLLLCSAVIRASTDGLDPETKSRILVRITESLTRKAFAFNTDFDRWPEILGDHQKSIDTASTTRTFEEAVDNALNEFGISHIYLMSPRIKSTDTTSEIYRLGISGPNTTTGIFVTHVAKGSPAELVGIQKLDVITSINDQSPAKHSDLKAAQGETISIQWTRTGQSLSGELICKIFERADDPWIEWPQKNVAVIHIHGFGSNAYKMIAVSRLFREARDAKAVIIDLRDNYGGKLQNALHLAGKVMSRDQVFALHMSRRLYSKFEYNPKAIDTKLSIEAKQRSRKLRPSFSLFRYGGKLAVLVDKSSASASDIFAAAVQEHNRGLVIGTQSRGALIGSKVVGLPHGFRLTYPFVEVLTSQGKRLENNGVLPDIELTFRETADDDYIYNVAIEALDLDNSQ